MVDPFSIPLPPPWRQVVLDHKPAFMNDLTGVMTDTHPLQAIIDMVTEQQRLIAQAPRIENNVSNLMKPEVNSMFSPNASNNQPLNMVYSDNSNNNDMNGMFATAPQFPPKPQSGKIDQSEYENYRNVSLPSSREQLTLPPLVGDAGIPSTAGLSLLPKDTAPSPNECDPSKEYVEFRCNWKEKGLFGNTNAFGLVIRYYSSQKIMVCFDDVDAKWEFSQLEGPHGPLSRYDLFVGAKVKLFGRTLTICSCNATVCHAIEMEGQRLAKKANWLQSKIESVGMQPCIKRTSDAGGTVIRHISRSSKSYGSVNLRKSSLANMKLREQMIAIGLQQVLMDYEEKERLAADKRYRSGGNFEARLLYDER